jgi:hypothetical protein
MIYILLSFTLANGNSPSLCPVLLIQNTSGNEGWPFISEYGNELWITRDYNGCPGLFRSFKNPDGCWSEPALIVSQFTGEASLDNDGNLYFTHHFYEDGVMLESDIYAACKK